MTRRHIAPALVPLYLRNAIDALEAAAECTPSEQEAAEARRIAADVRGLLNGGGQ